MRVDVCHDQLLMALSECAPVQTQCFRCCANVAANVVPAGRQAGSNQTAPKVNRARQCNLIQLALSQLHMRTLAPQYVSASFESHCRTKNAAFTTSSTSVPRRVGCPKSEKDFSLGFSDPGSPELHSGKTVPYLCCKMAAAGAAAAGEALQNITVLICPMLQRQCGLHSSQSCTRVQSMKPALRHHAPTCQAVAGLLQPCSPRQHQARPCATHAGPGMHELP